ncbi:TetR family transcriptional regulator [Variovorax dokdonensis]|uniref:TetR family transcriptional regulator n=1 Tax=Variovorax dokdonensis TaxID=344883 RepID=A0ABT7NG75_9BURK|nr:TetR family transcriptional regulator [Variovorax dokdonensis]MDM0046927.1 TetR family transcriptional regulator [Variovorax dokdonensis]
MARRTKEEALATRERLLDAAEVLFQEQGVSRTTLQQIAQACGATRGAVYWHFKDKADLFNAMMDRVTLPLEAANRAGMEAGAEQPLFAARTTLVTVLRVIATDPAVRRVVDIATRKIEYTDEMQAVQRRHIESRRLFLNDFEDALRSAARLAGHRLPLPVAMAAQGLHSIIGGLVQDWLLEPEAFDLVEAGERVLLVYLTGLGFGPQWIQPAKSATHCAGRGGLPGSTLK